MKQIDDEGMERILEFSPAFDRRDPNPHKNYGVHGVEMRFVLKGPLGAVQFVLYTNWNLPHVQQEFDNDPTIPKSIMGPMPADLGFHSPGPVYEGQEPLSQTCPYMEGCPCYYDGSGLNARRPWKVLLEEGEEALWKFLREYYQHVFVQNDYTDASELERPRG